MMLRTANHPSRSRRVHPAGVEVRFWRRGDTEAINRLYNDPAVRPGAAARGYVPRTDEQWVWEHAIPSGGDPAYVVAIHEDRIVATQSYIPIEFLFDGRRILTGKSEDTLIHPDYRGMGLLDEMYQLLFRRAERDGVQVIWGFTNTAVRPLLRNGFRSIGRFEAMRARLPFARVDFDHPCFIVREVVKPDERCDGFSLDFGSRFEDLTPHLSAQYLRWRACDDPYFVHRVFSVSVEDRLVGLSVFKLDDREKTGFVSELAAMPGGLVGVEDLLHALLQPGLELFRTRGYQSAEARFTGPHPFNRTVRTVLAQCGFEEVKNDRAVEFLVRPMRPGGERFLDYGAWRITELMREY